MLKKALLTYKERCEAETKLYSRLLSMFRPQYDYPAKIAAINKLLLDIDLTDVRYTQRDLDILNRGKLAQMLKDHHHDVPTRLNYEKSRVIDSLQKRSSCK